MSVKITFFRHASTPDTEMGIAAGQNDFPLSQNGMRQAEGLGSSSDRFDCIFTSSLERAVRTAQIAWGVECGGVITPDARLNDCNLGYMAGQQKSLIDIRLPTQIWVPFPGDGGESYSGMGARVKSFLDDLRATRDGQHVAIVAHENTQIALDVHVGGMQWRDAFPVNRRRVDEMTIADWQRGWEYVLS